MKRTIFKVVQTVLLSLLLCCSCDNTKNKDSTHYVYSMLSSDLNTTYDSEYFETINELDLDYLNSSLSKVHYKNSDFYKQLTNEQNNYLLALDDKYKQALTNRDKNYSNISVNSSSSIVKVSKLNTSYLSPLLSIKKDYTCSLKESYLIWSLDKEKLLKSCHSDSLIKPRPTILYNTTETNSIESQESIISFVNFLSFDDTNNFKVNLNEDDYCKYLLDKEFNVNNAIHLSAFEVLYSDETIETYFVVGQEITTSPIDLLCRIYKFITPTIFYESISTIDYQSLIGLFNKGGE